MATVGVGDNILSGYESRARVGGSGFTVFAWQNKPILFARQISHQSPTPVGPGTVPIHPMDTPYPVELITPQAATMGSITLELYELYYSSVWERLHALSTAPTEKGEGETSPGHGPVDIVGIFQNIANMGDPLRIFKYIRPPRIRGLRSNPYTEEYHNCVVSQLNDGETIEVGTMEVLKTMVVNYTHLTRGGRNQILHNRTNLGAARDASDVPSDQYR